MFAKGKLEILISLPNGNAKFRFNCLCNRFLIPSFAMPFCGVILIDLLVNISDSVINLNIHRKNVLLLTLDSVNLSKALTLL